MRTLRRRLRFFAASWVLLQAATLSVLVPLCCCQVEVEAAATPSSHCHQEQSTSDQPTTVFKACCDPHAQALSALLGGDAILSRSAVSIAFECADGVSTPRLPARSWPTPVDSPPPRA